MVRMSQPGGVTPFAAFIFSPLIGYAGDKVIFQDYEPCLTIAPSWGTSLCWGSLYWPPWCQEEPSPSSLTTPGTFLRSTIPSPLAHLLLPQAAVVGFDSSTSPPWESVSWVGHYGACTSPPVLVGVQCGGVQWRGEVLLGSSCSAGEEGRCGEESTCTYQCLPPAPNASAEFCRWNN